jgi:hypothetical protein
MANTGCISTEDLISTQELYQVLDRIPEFDEFFGNQKPQWLGASAAPLHIGVD